MNSVVQKLESLLPSSDIVQWEKIEGTRKAQISQAIAPGTTLDCIVYPQTEEELAQVMAYAYQQRWGVLPCGSASKLGWGGLVDGVNLVISTERLNRLIAHAVGDLTVTVEAGMKFAELQKILAQQSQFLALDPAYPEDATVGGIVATAWGGSLRQRYGGVRDMLLGLSFVRSDGQIAKAGGRVVKNVAGYDMMKLFIGSFGTLGIVSQVTFRVYPLPEASATVVLTGTAEGIAAATKTLLASALTPTAVDLLSTQIVASLGLGEGIGALARFQSVSPSVKEQCARWLEVGQHLGLQGALYSDADDAELWQKLQEQMWASHTETAIACKIGVLPTAAATILTHLQMHVPSVMCLIHAGSGLGLLRCNGDVVETTAIAFLQQMRSLCESHGGFLTILEAPHSLKQQLEVWGYTGNALDLMQKIKTQFDPENILSPSRFVGGM